MSDKTKAKIKQSADNMNNVKNEKYGISPNNIKEKLLCSEKFKSLFSFKRIEQSKKVSDRIDKYYQRKYTRKKKVTGKFRCR